MMQDVLNPIYSPQSDDTAFQVTTTTGLHVRRTQQRQSYRLAKERNSSVLTTRRSTHRKSTNYFASTIKHPLLQISMPKISISNTSSLPVLTRIAAPLNSSSCTGSNKYASTKKPVSLKPISQDRNPNLAQIDNNYNTLLSRLDPSMKPNIDQYRNMLLSAAVKYDRRMGSVKKNPVRQVYIHDNTYDDGADLTFDIDTPHYRDVIL